MKVEKGDSSSSWKITAQDNVLAKFDKGTLTLPSGSFSAIKSWVAVESSTLVEHAGKKRKAMATTLIMHNGTVVSMLIPADSERFPVFTEQVNVEELL